jgi:hypothetical protein
LIDEAGCIARLEAGENELIRRLRLEYSSVSCFAIEERFSIGIFQGRSTSASKY